MLKGCFLEKDKIREIPIRDKKGQNLRLKLEGSYVPKGKMRKDRISYPICKVVWGQQSNDPEKVITIEELLWKNGKRLRFGYHTITSSKAKHHKGVWWWGQSALIVPAHDIEELLQLAKENGLIHF